MEVTAIDRISDLPDVLILRTLSFLPSTDSVVRTSLLSKRWLRLWREVPALRFDLTRGLLRPDSLQFVDHILASYLPSTIETFQLRYDFQADPQFESKMRFTISRNVRDLTLRYVSTSTHPLRPYHYFFVDSISSCTSLVSLELERCVFKDTTLINWPSLIRFRFPHTIHPKTLQKVLSGSPSLQVLELETHSQFDVNPSSLTTLVSINAQGSLQINCPRLKCLRLLNANWIKGPHIASACLTSPCLQLLELTNYSRLTEDLVIRSNSLRNLVLSNIEKMSAIEIQCPSLKVLCLEQLDLSCGGTIRLLELPSSLQVTLAYKHRDCSEDTVKQILQQLSDVRELKIGSSVVEILSDLERQAIHYPRINSECLIMKGFDYILGVVWALKNSPALENLILNLQPPEQEHQTLTFGCFRVPMDDNYWRRHPESRSLVTKLRFVEIIGLCKQDTDYIHVLQFIEFLLNNASVLSKMTIVLRGASSINDVFTEVGRFHTSSPSAIIEVLGS